MVAEVENAVKKKENLVPFQVKRRKRSSKGKKEFFKLFLYRIFASRVFLLLTIQRVNK